MINQYEPFCECCKEVLLNTYEAIAKAFESGEGYLQVLSEIKSLIMKAIKGRQKLKGDQKLLKDLLHGSDEEKGKAYLLLLKGANEINKGIGIFHDKDEERSKYWGEPESFLKRINSILKNIRYQLILAYLLGEGIGVCPEKDEDSSKYWLKRALVGINEMLKSDGLHEQH